MLFCIQICQGNPPGKDAMGTRIPILLGLNPKANLPHHPHHKFTKEAKHRT